MCQHQQLYAYYKQATQDPPIDKAENPGTFDFKVSDPMLEVSAKCPSLSDE